VEILRHLHSEEPSTGEEGASGRAPGAESGNDE
jgi:hypothetical protein